MRHGIAAEIVSAYGMYEECFDGGFDPEWADLPQERIEYHGFWLSISSQTLKYHPSNRKYKHESNSNETEEPKPISCPEKIR